jgi:hypothetical protein
MSCAPDFPDGQVVPPDKLLPFNCSVFDEVFFDYAPDTGTILWEGSAPGLIFGVDQINVQLSQSLTLPGLPPITSVTAVPMVVVAGYAVQSPPFSVFVAP